MGLTGRCLCGQAAFSSSGKLAFTGVCHCRNCQRQSGAPLSAFVAVPAETLSLTGQLKTFEDRADSGAVVRRQFCPDCGSPLFSRLADQPDLVLIKMGVLDDVSQLQPRFQIWCDSAQPWLKIDPEIRPFPKAAPAR